MSVIIRVIVLFFMCIAYGSANNYKEGRRENAWDSISSVFTAGWNLDDHLVERSRRYPASFTVEATMVLGIVMLVISALIGQAYRVHDTVTGTMILEEVLVKACGAGDSLESVDKEQLESYGEALGNPRLWLGRYELETEVGTEKVSGKAAAGDWAQEMELKRSEPSRFLLRYEAIREIGEELTNDGSGIQARDESELYGDSSGNSGK